MSEEKDTWPELIGKTAEEAKAAINAEAPGLHVEILEEGSFVTFDYKTDRVRIFVNQEGKISLAPSIG